MMSSTGAQNWMADYKVVAISTPR